VSKVPCLDCGRLHEQVEACPVEWVQVGEDEGVPIYSEVNMSETNDPDYQWRPATKGDIGSVARFGDTDSKHEPWSYGIVKDVIKDEMYGWQFTCEANIYMDEDEKFMHCQIQYDANQEP